MAERTGRARPLRSGFAAWFAVLLTVLPFAQPAAPIDLPPVRIAPEYALASHADAEAPVGQPTPRVRPAQPWDLGVLARWWHLEAKPGLAPTRPDPVRFCVGARSQMVPKTALARAGDPRDIFHQSSVGTARRPTGPPDLASASA